MNANYRWVDILSVLDSEFQKFIEEAFVVLVSFSERTDRTIPEDFEGVFNTLTNRRHSFGSILKDKLFSFNSNLRLFVFLLYTLITRGSSFKFVSAFRSVVSALLNTRSWILRASYRHQFLTGENRFSSFNFSNTVSIKTRSGTIGERFIRLLLLQQVIVLYSS